MRRRFLVSMAVADVAALVVALFVASFGTFRTVPWSIAAPGGRSIWPLIGFFLSGAVLGSVLSSRMWKGSAPRPTYGRGLAIVAFGVAFASLGVTATFSYISRTFFATTSAVWLLGALAHRAVRRRRPWTERIVVITNEKELVDDLRNAPHTDVVDLLDPGATGPVEPLEQGVTLVVDLRAVLSDRMAQYASSCALAGYPVRALSGVYEEHTGRIPVIHLAEGWEISAPVMRTAPYVGGKRVFDFLAVLLTSPFWLLLAGAIALWVRMDSPGPVIFKQVRAGRHGQPFTLYKFRTMKADAESDGPQFAQHNDHRLTGAGRVLRRFRIDEIPQLWNVLKGDLSLVGPRPEQLHFVKAFTEAIPFYAERHLIRPGVTGWAQINYGYADDQADAIDKLTYDLYYVKHMSPWLDLHVLGSSLWTVVSGFGAR